MPSFKEKLAALFKWDKEDWLFFIIGVVLGPIALIMIMYVEWRATRRRPYQNNPDENHNSDKSDDMR